VRDELTGIFDAEFFRATLELRITAARRFLRPLAIVVFETGGARANDVSAAAKMTLREVDVLGIDGPSGAYALLLEDTSDAGAVEAVMRLRDRLDRVRADHPFVAGIACYPMQGIEPAELLERARVALVAARTAGRDHIEVG
jgi:GGDEF domain-containing protein